jgi:hypothetical protein
MGYFMKKIFLKLSLLSILFIPIGCGDTNITDPNDYSVKISENDSAVTAAAEPPTKNDRTSPSKKGNAGIFQDLLVKLDLTIEQKSLVDTLLIRHKECTANCIKILKDAERTILINTKVQNAQLKKDLDSGKITREEFRKLSNEIRKATHLELKSLPEKTKVRECLVACDSEFILRLERILNDTQKDKLKAWLELKAKRGTSTGRG